jgi:hypothetical protein
MGSSVPNKKPDERVVDEPHTLESAPILPATCVRTKLRINKLSEVIYKTNRYSVPSKFSHREAIIEAFHDRICVYVYGGVLIAEHERTFAKRKAVLDVVHFLDRLSYEQYGIVHAEVLRRRRFHRVLNSLLHRYIESNPASASKRFGRVVALLEHHSMQEVFDAIEEATQSDADDLATITLILKHARRPYDADANSLHVFDSERFRVDRHNWYREQVKFDTEERPRDITIRVESASFEDL